MSDSCFQLKGSVLTVVVLELYQYASTAFAKQLQQKVKQAPMFFQGSPVVISLEKLTKETKHIDFTILLGLCTKYGLKPMAFKGGDGRFQDAIKATGLTHLPAASLKTVVEQEEKPELAAKADPESEVKTIVEEKLIPCPSMLITQPVRSGQQIYAKQADLIIMSNVSEGAEVLADGHIHVYGALRGRALAGAQGDESARIFSRSMEAELLSIAGNFILNEEIRARVWKECAQVYFADNVLHIKSL